MKNFITGRKYEETISKLNILGIERKELNNWAEIIETDEYVYNHSRIMDRYEAFVHNGNQTMSINIRDKQTIIEGIQAIIYFEKYLIITFKDNSRLLVTTRGKMIGLEKEIYSKRADIKFKIGSDERNIEFDSELAILDIEDEKAMVIINEEGRVLKVNTGYNKASTKVVRAIKKPNQTGLNNVIDYTINISNLYKYIDNTEEDWMKLYVDKNLNVIQSKKGRDGRKLTWEWL